MTRPISVPLRTGPRGYFAKARDLPREIHDSLRQIIFINPGERFMRNDLGVPLHSFVFDPVDEIFQATIENYVRAQVERFEKRIDLIGVGATREELDNGGIRVTLTIAYAIKGSDIEVSTKLNETFVRTRN